jgi:hypothetical protein
MKIDIKLLRNICTYPNEEEYRVKLYENLVDMAWWSNNSTTNDIERERFLYEAFMGYYSVIMNDEVREIEESLNKDKDRLWLINICKIQLDKELRRVENKDYEREEE